MNTWETKHDFYIAQVLSGRSNAYLIQKGKHKILIDTGKKSACSTIEKNLKTFGISIHDLTTLILTHTHFDHCQSAKHLKQISQCEIIVSATAKYFINEGYTPLPKGTLFLTKPISWLGQQFGKRKFGYSSFKADQLVELKNGALELMDGIKLLSTPGHSADSLSVIIDDELAIVGDVMFGVFKNSIFPPFADDTKKMVQSWGKLLETSCTTFLPGHGKAIERNLLQSEFEKYNV